MIVISAQHIAKAFGVNQVLRDVSFVLQNGQRLGLVGVNGCGKSTLLRILNGEMKEDSGVISVQKGVRIGYLAQSWRPRAGATVLEEMAFVFRDIAEMEQKMRRIEDEMSKTADEETLRRLGDEYARTLQRFEAAEGYACKSRVQGVLAGLGFDEQRQHMQAEKLSGGEITRLCLGRLLLEKPDVLLLDEPTNHLDLATLKWLEDFLNEYTGAVMLVSHDRYFLDRVCTDIVEILMGVSEQYKGNYTRYIEQRVERFEARRRAYDRQQKEIERQEAIIERFRSFNREKSIRAAESRAKRLEKLERLERPEEERQINFSFEAAHRMGDDALSVKNYKKAFDGRVLFENADLFLHSGDRAVMIGANGIGKTTFLECLMGTIAADDGISAFGANCDIGYYDQKQQRLHDAKTVIDEVWDDFPRLTQTEVRGALGLFLFSGDDVFAPVSTLSGGERARVALTKLMLRKDNFLILDEPTNHLDADSREMLEEALDGFDGTILSVSHDRYFINRIANKVIVMERDGLRVYEGNFDDYLAALEKEKNGNGSAENGITKTEQTKRLRRSREEQAKMKAMKEQVSNAEKAVADAEQNCLALEQEMTKPGNYSAPDKAKKLSEDYRMAKERLNEAYLAWEKAATALESFDV